jgi:predicted tellurium resistance membrane protein TerC
LSAPDPSAADTVVLLAYVILVTLALSGDNMVALALAMRGLPPSDRWFAALVGGGAAILVCIGLAIGATLLLRLAGVKLVGGGALVVISALQLREQESPTQARRSPLSEAGAIVTMFVVELSVSLDNVLGAAAAAAGNLPVLIVGLSSGMALVLMFAVQVAQLLSRSVLFTVLAAGIVAWAGARLAIADPLLADRGMHVEPVEWLVPAVIAGAGLVRWLMSVGSPVRSRRR